MSYCRWSNSDIYAYESDTGYCIHVSGNVGLPQDGQHYLLDDLESFRAKMIELRKAGYRIPDYVFTAIDAERAHGDEYLELIAKAVSIIESESSPEARELAEAVMDYFKETMEGWGDDAR